VSATTTQLLSSGEFYKLRYDAIPVKIAFANVSFYTDNSKMSNFDFEVCQPRCVYKLVGGYAVKNTTLCVLLDVIFI